MLRPASRSTTHRDRRRQSRCCQCLVYRRRNPGVLQGRCEQRRGAAARRCGGLGFVEIGDCKSQSDVERLSPKGSLGRWSVAPSLLLLVSAGQCWPFQFRTPLLPVFERLNRYRPTCQRLHRVKFFIARVPVGRDAGFLKCGFVPRSRSRQPRSRCRSPARWRGPHRIPRRRSRKSRRS